MMYARQPVCVAALAAAALALVGCGAPAGGSTPNGGELTLDFAPTSPAVAPLQLTSAKLQVEQVTVIGDVAPDARSMISELSIDLLSAGVSHTFTMLPQGLYSRVRFHVDEMAAQGTWNGVPLVVRVDFGDASSPIDLRSSAGVEIAPGHNGMLTVAIDGASWFGSRLLDGATQSSSQILVDGTNNVAIAQALATRVAASFALHDSPVP
jgi:hypothetical protein